MARPKRANHTGSISHTPRADGRYEARLTMPDGQRRSFYGATWAEAEAKLQQARADLARGVLPPDGRATLDQLWQEYDRLNPGNHRASTRRVHRSIWTHHIAPHIGSIRLAGLSPLHIQRVVTAARASDLAPATVQHIFAVLRLVCEQGVTWRMLGYNPATGISVAAGPGRSLPIERRQQVEALLDAFRDSPRRAALLLGAGLGLRSGEVRALRWSDVDLDDGQVHIRHSVAQTSEGLILGEPKTTASRRTLPLPPFLLDALRRQRREVAALQLAASDWTDLDLVVPGRNGRIMASDTLLSAVRDACHAAGVEPLTFHHLRHLCATILLMEGVAPRTAQAILGHARIETTMRVYSHINRELLESATDAMDAVFSRLRVDTGN